MIKNKTVKKFKTKLLINTFCKIDRSIHLEKIKINNK